MKDHIFGFLLNICIIENHEWIYKQTFLFELL